MVDRGDEVRFQAAALDYCVQIGSRAHPASSPGGKRPAYGSAHSLASDVEGENDGAIFPSLQTSSRQGA
jgi:hypothetical protein